MHKYQIGYDVHGYYVCTKDEARKQDLFNETPPDVNNRPHYKTLKEARASIKAKIACTK